MLKTGCLNKHPEVRTNSSSDWSQRYNSHWHLAIRAGKWRWSGTRARNESVTSFSFFSCLPLLKKPGTFILKALFVWRAYICPLYVSPIQMFVPQQPQSSSMGWFWVFNCFSDMPCPRSPWRSQLFGNLCVYILLSPAGFLMLSQFWFYARGFPVSVTGELPIYSAYCECSDLCAIVYQITLPLSRWVFISVSYPL